MKIDLEPDGLGMARIIVGGALVILVAASYGAGALLAWVLA